MKLRSAEGGAVSWSEILSPALRRGECINPDEKTAFPQNDKRAG
jgi:hypothetical protein